MEVNRQELSSLLSTVMEECGEQPHLYFQPPESVKMEYPCIVYHLRTMTAQYADNRPYTLAIGFDVTYISRSPTSEVPTRLAKEPLFGFDRYYRADNLHHYAYTTTNTLKEVSDGNIP